MNQEPIHDAVAHEILMHREAHFGGKFSFMLNYYKKQGKGVNPAFSLDRIAELEEIEVSLKENLAGAVLTGSEAEKVAKSKTMYQSLRDLYEKEQESEIPRLIADLILSEDEEPEAEINALIERKSAAVPSLVTLLNTTELYDPLFPGYGLAPEQAAKCLGKIGDKRALYTIFENIGNGDFNFENRLIEALKAIGEPAKEFLLTILHIRPISNDTERAAVAAIAFKEDEQVAKAALDLLKQPDVTQNIALTTYLVLLCEGLQDPTSREELLALSIAKDNPDIKQLQKVWKQ